MQIKAVIFDLDDTLIDWSGVTHSLREVYGPHIRNLHNHFANLNAPNLLPLDDFMRQHGELVSAEWQIARKTFRGVTLGNIVRQQAAEAGLETATFALDAALQKYDWQPVPNVTLFEDTLPVLNTLRQRGMRLGLVTNAMLPMWMRDRELEAYGLADLLDAAITSGDTRYIKPHPAIYWRIMGLLNMMPENCIFVGDRPANDIAGANEVGMVSVWHKPAHITVEKEGVEPDFTISRLRELLPIIDQLTEIGR